MSNFRSKYHQVEYTIRPYTPDDAPSWNEFVRDACNATFLFNRQFMDYHADRFADHSLIVESDGKWEAVLPAHLTNGELYSHFGLTYGGLVYGPSTKMASVVMMLQTILEYLHGRGIGRLHIKTLPSIYHQRPAQELHFALFLVDAKLTRRDALSVIDRRSGFKISKTRREGIRRGEKNGLLIREEAIFDAFWNDILIPNLRERHQTSPVHSLEEIKMLHSRFPEQIRHFNVYHREKLVAGTTVFVSDLVAHPQYVSGEDERNALGSIDFLYDHLINKVFTDKPFFDFGISQEDGGRKVNGGLLFWKESYGAGTITQDYYSVETANFALPGQFLL